MRILFISTYFLPYISGLTVYPYRLFTYLASNRYSVQVVVFKHDKNLPSKETIDGITIERVNYWFTISKGFFAPFFVCSLLKYIRKTDAVIINQPSLEGVGVLLIARIFNKKVISLYHCTLQSHNDIFQKLLYWVVNTIVYFELVFSDCIVATNADYIKKSLSLLKHKIKIIMPPIEQYPFLQNIYNDFIRIKTDHIWIGFCGRISREKGLEYLIEAYKIIQTKIPSATLVFAGPSGDEVRGEKSYYRKIKRLLREKKIPHIFLGKLNNKTMGAFYKAIDCLVLPSINSTEAFGMVQAEAMLFDTPVVASDLPGVRVPIQLTGMGIIVPPKNAHALAQALIRVIAHRSQYANNQLVNKAKKIFDLSYFFEQWECLLQQIKTELSLKA